MITGETLTGHSAMQQLKSLPLYFGKSPAWGDFLKSKGQSALVQVLDQWLTESLETAMTMPIFTQAYKHLPSVDFFIANPEDEMFLIANLIASEDSSGRQFPMVIGHLLDVQNPWENLQWSLFQYKPVLMELYQKNRILRSINDPDILLNKLSKISTEITAYTDFKVRNFYEQHTLYSFADLLKMQVTTLVQRMLALGLLLQPVQKYGTGRLKKALYFPGLNAMYVHEAAAFWCSLITMFLAGQDAELLSGIIHADEPVMLFGFQGADITVLSDILIQNLQNERWISIAESAWINAYIEQNAGLAALEQALNERQLSLSQALKIFRQYFIEEQI